MPHQCVHCGKIYPLPSEELLNGCSDCGGKFFFFFKDVPPKKKIEEQIPVNLTEEEKVQIEIDVREIIGLNEEESVILDLESVRVRGTGKFEIDLVNLFSKDRPLIYKLEEGKYIIDLARTLKLPKTKSVE